jgi:protein-tyrosine phosphatase
VSERDQQHSERLIALEGALNWRDLGGYETANGRVTRWGRVYRADGLDQLTDADLDLIAGLGIRLVIDFRVDREVDLAPSRLPDHPELRRHRLPIGEDVAATTVIERIQSGEITSYTEEQVAATYEKILDDAAPEFGTALTHAADPANHPMVFHCTAGKDRTGLMAMLLLGALDVPRDEIVRDYELTTHYRSSKRLVILRPQLEAAGVDVDAVLPFLTAQAPVMAATITALEARHGSIEGYLRGPAGLTAGTLADLRAHLSEPVKA